MKCSKCKNNAEKDSILTGEPICGECFEKEMETPLTLKQFLKFFYNQTLNKMFNVKVSEAFSFLWQ